MCYDYSSTSIQYSKALRYADFGLKSISVAQKTVYIEVIWKPFETVYLSGFVWKNDDNQCNFWQFWNCVPSKSVLLEALLLKVLLYLGWLRLVVRSIHLETVNKKFNSLNFFNSFKLNLVVSHKDLPTWFP